MDGRRSRLADVTVMGALQRLGLVYLLTGLITRWPLRRQVDRRWSRSAVLVADRLWRRRIVITV